MSARRHSVPPTPARAWDNLAVYHVAHGPFPTRRRGRRPRRPFLSSIADLTTFFQPLVGAGFRPRPALCRYRRGCGRLRPPAKGEPPARVPPLTPSCASLAQGEFRALRRASMGSAPGPRPLFCKKAGQKTFKRQSTSDPSPSPLGRVMKYVREADTLAAEWHLPREWERRVGPETSRGRHHPKRFSLGLHPVSLGKTKEMGWNRQHNLKSSRTKRRVPPSQNPPPGGAGPPPPQRQRPQTVNCQTKCNRN